MLSIFAVFELLKKSTDQSRGLSFGVVAPTEVGDFVWGSSISVAAEATVFDTATTIELVAAQLAFVTAFVALEVADTRFVEAVS